MVLTTFESRLVTAERLVQGGFVRPANRDRNLFFVRSPENCLHDHVVRVRDQVVCDCPTFVRRGECVHVIAVKAVLQRHGWNRKAV